MLVSAQFLSVVVDSTVEGNERLVTDVYCIQCYCKMPGASPELSEETSRLLQGKEKLNYSGSFMPQSTYKITSFVDKPAKSYVQIIMFLRENLHGAGCG